MHYLWKTGQEGGRGGGGRGRGVYEGASWVMCVCAVLSMMSFVYYSWLLHRACLVNILDRYTHSASAGHCPRLPYPGWIKFRRQRVLISANCNIKQDRTHHIREGQHADSTLSDFWSDVNIGPLILLGSNGSIKKITVNVILMFVFLWLYNMWWNTKIVVE